MTLSSLRQVGWLALVLALVVALLPLAAPTPTLAQEAPPAPAADDGPAIVQVSDDEPVRTIVTSTYGSNGTPFAPQSTVTTGPGGVWRVRYKNQISHNRGRARWIRYDYAETRRLSGSGDYRVNAHAMLVIGNQRYGEYAFATLGSQPKYPCAGETAVNRTARTCSSPAFATSPGQQWYVISGHFFDADNDGMVDDDVDGEMDYVWTAPRR